MYTVDSCGKQPCFINDRKAAASSHPLPIIGEDWRDSSGLRVHFFEPSCIFRAERGANDHRRRADSVLRARGIAEEARAFVMVVVARHPEFSLVEARDAVCSQLVRRSEPAATVHLPRGPIGGREAGRRGVERHSAVAQKKRVRPSGAYVGSSQLCRTFCSRR